MLWPKRPLLLRIAQLLAFCGEPVGVVDEDGADDDSVAAVPVVHARECAAVNSVVAVGVVGAAVEAVGA